MIKDEQILDLYHALLPFGWGDLKWAVDTIEEYGIDMDDFGDYIDAYALYVTDVSLRNMDICAAVYEYILDKVRIAVEDCTHKDIRELKYPLEVYANYLDTQWNSVDSTVKYLKRAIKKYPELEEDYFIRHFLNDIQGL